MGDQGDLAAAVPLLVRAIALIDRAEPDSARLVEPLINLVLTELELGAAAAGGHAERLRAIAVRIAGPAGAADPTVFFPLVLVGWTRLAAGDARAAVRELAPLLGHPGFAEAMAGEQIELVRALAQALHDSGGPIARVDALVAQATALLGADDLSPRRRAQIERELAALAAPSSPPH